MIYKSSTNMKKGQKNSFDWCNRQILRCNVEKFLLMIPTQIMVEIGVQIFMIQNKQGRKRTREENIDVNPLSSY